MPARETERKPDGNLLGLWEASEVNLAELTNAKFVCCLYVNVIRVLDCA